MKLSDLFIVNLLREIFQLPIWWLQAFRKRDPKTWVFGAWYGNTYSDNCKSMYEYVLANHPEINAVWITGNNQVYNKLKCRNLPVALKGTIEAKALCLKAGFVFITIFPTDIESSYINGAKQVWLWHGMPLKKIGKDKVNKFGIKARIHHLFPQNRLVKPDYFISTSHNWDSIFNRAFEIRHSQIITGLPRNDRFFDTTTEDYIKGINLKFDNPTKILYMPTYRDSLYNNRCPFNPFNSFGFSIDRFTQLLKDVNAVFFYKGHYFDILNQHLSNSPSERFILINDSMYQDLYSFIKDVDILMTDYSSVYFDFLLLRKPVILTPFDMNDYCNNSRSMYFDYDQTMKGVKAYNWDDVINIIKEKKYYVPDKSVVDNYHEHQDGNSSKRVTDFILNLI